jgi:hypothetical protein
MRFDKSVPDADRARIAQALRDIKTYGTARHAEVARFIENSEISIELGTAEKVGGSGSTLLTGAFGINWTISRGVISLFDAWRFVRLRIARETIDTGGQRGIEGTFVHEGKHAADLARMIADFSVGDQKRLFDPTAFQREYSAHLTAAFYLMRRGGEYAAEGLSLGILSENEGAVGVSGAGIRERLKNNYGLTPEAPGKRLSELTFPNIAPRGTKLWGMF